jgi:hypothetical protein
MNYIAVFDGERNNWALARESLIASLNRDWPDAVLKQATPAARDARDVWWSYPIAGQLDFEAWAPASGHSLWTNGDLAGSALFCAWYRGLIPGEIEVTFCDNGYNIHFPILASMSSQDIVDEADRQWTEIL